MRRRHFTQTTLTLATAAVLVLAGCRSHREATRPPLPPPTDSVEATVQEAEPPAAPPCRIARIYATVQGTRVDGQLRMQPDSVIWVCATKVIELGRAMCTPDSVVVYAKVAGRCFRGSYLDVYRRFGWRTDFATLQRMVTDPQAEKELAAIARRFNIEASVHIDDWKEVEKTTFPMAIPKQIKPL